MKHKWLVFIIVSIYNVKSYFSGFDSLVALDYTHLQIILIDGNNLLRYGLILSGKKALESLYNKKDSESAFICT